MLSLSEVAAAGTAVSCPEDKSSGVVRLLGSHRDASAYFCILYWCILLGLRSSICILNLVCAYWD